MTERRDGTSTADEPGEAGASQDIETADDTAITEDRPRAGTTGESIDETEEAEPRHESATAEPGVPEPLSTPVRSGVVDTENAAFVVLGALITVALVLRLASVAL